MSYILDALRRADQERRRQGVPTVHTQRQAPAQAETELEPASQAHPWAWGLSLGAVLLGGLALWAWWSEPSEVLEPPSPSAALGAVRSEAMPPMASSPALAPVVPMAAPAHTAAAPSARGAQPAPPASPPVATMASPVTQATAAARPAAPPAMPARPEPAASAVLQRIDPVLADASTAVPPPTPLPANLKSEWALNVAGSIYSERPADRLLIVDGQLVREGESLREGVVLEAIQPKAAVLRHQGKRYTVAF